MACATESNVALPAAFCNTWTSSSHGEHQSEMSALPVHQDERYFKRQHRLGPGRWKGFKPRNRYFIPFAKGSRVYFDMELAKVKFPRLRRYVPQVRAGDGVI